MDTPPKKKKMEKKLAERNKLSNQEKECLSIQGCYMTCHGFGMIQQLMGHSVKSVGGVGSLPSISMNLGT